MYIDIHTHKALVENDDVLSVQSVYKDLVAVQDGWMCSVGLHPWYLERWESQLAMLADVVRNDNVLAVGECGLDKVCDTPWQVQEVAFGKQIDLANTVAKPLIIHCVRAYDEVRAMLRERKVAVPVVIHGYNKKGLVAERLLREGYYLSFGAALLYDGSPAAAALLSVPAERFFLETDDSAIAIQDIYAKAAEIRKTSLNDLILQVEQNFKRVLHDGYSMALKDRTTDR
ncbi:MAG: TatD family hydrolase [Bacteroidota bacterium]